jgi:hypothetical protein
MLVIFLSSVSKRYYIAGRLENVMDSLLVMRKYPITMGS